MSSNISNALQKHFAKHRIIFWYDPESEMQEAFDEAWLLGIEKLEINDNEFGLKYHLLREKPNQRFLLYYAGEQPKDLDNWLLDVQLAHGVFSADQISIWMNELELGPEYRGLVAEHRNFFRAESRREALKARDIKQPSHRELRYKMMAVCLRANDEARLESILMGLLDELAAGKDDSHTALQKNGLLKYLWHDLETIYGYQSKHPHIKDFAINLFEACYKMSFHDPAELNNEAMLFLNHWQDSHKSRESFEILSDQFAEDLNIKQDLQKRSLSELLSLDLFRIIDYRILESLMAGVIDRSIPEKQCREILHRRSATYWFSKYSEGLYQAVDTASALLTRLTEFHFHIDSIKDGIKKYTSNWYEIDQLYREYIYAVRRSKQATFFKNLNQMIEGHYNNTFLKPLNNNWQLVVDEVLQWDKTGINMQRHFYGDFVEPILGQNAKVAVIISDALRYEIGEALCKRIKSEGRFSSEINAMLGMLPSYTQLGMAALLPNQTLEIQGVGTVFVDGLSSAGKDNRSKILAQKLPDASRVLLAADLVAMTREEGRALFRENQVVYIYHNQIDAVGDKLADEQRTVDAVASTIEELSDVIKKLTNANFTRVLVTADHGFLYQHQEIDESDFAITDIKGEKIYSRNRRYVVGENLEKQQSFKHFSAEEAGLTGDYEIMIAKSINRLRLSGAGIRFVHGGASLQEIVIPVISISKERTSEADVRPVVVDKINGGNNKIPTGLKAIKFYQTEPVTPKVTGRILRAGIYASDGILISNVHNLSFNFESANPRDREIDITFRLTNAADEYNNQMVFLRLEELIPNTTKYSTVQEWAYRLVKTLFTSF